MHVGPSRSEILDSILIKLFWNAHPYFWNAHPYFWNAHPYFWNAQPYFWNAQPYFCSLQVLQNFLSIQQHTYYCKLLQWSI